MTRRHSWFDWRHVLRFEGTWVQNTLEKSEQVRIKQSAMRHPI